MASIYPTKLSPSLWNILGPRLVSIYLKLLILQHKVVCFVYWGPGCSDIVASQLSSPIESLLCSHKAFISPESKQPFRLSSQRSLDVAWQGLSPNLLHLFFQPNYRGGQTSKSYWQFPPKDSKGELFYCWEAIKHPELVTSELFLFQYNVLILPVLFTHTVIIA